MSEKNLFTEEQVEEMLQELVDQYEDKIPPIQFITENLTEVEFDEKAFQEGINEISKTCGIITGLFNVGCSEAFILDLILNRETIKHNLESAKINNDANVEIAKQQKVIMDKQEL